MNCELTSQPVISIFGNYRPEPGDPLYETAYAIGYALAEAGFTVCNGGYSGTMEASARGAKEAGGSTIGATCSIFRNLKPNPYIDKEVLSDDLLTRIDTMVRMSAGYVVLNGGTGTLCELAIVWEFVWKGFIDPRPIFIVGDFWLPLVDRLTSAHPTSGQYIHCVNSPDQIIATLSNKDLFQR